LFSCKKDKDKKNQEQERRWFLWDPYIFKNNRAYRSSSLAYKNHEWHRPCNSILKRRERCAQFWARRRRRKIARIPRRSSN